LSDKIGRIVIKHRQDELRNISHKDTKKLRSNVRPVISDGATSTTLADKYGSLFVDLDAINAHFVSVATDPDYDINEKSLQLLTPYQAVAQHLDLFLNMKYSSY